MTDAPEIEPPVVPSNSSACCAKFAEMAGSVSSVALTAMIYTAAGISNDA
jgi:hypothetical protein